jgi:hypothetical protein
MNQFRGAGATLVTDKPKRLILPRAVSLVSDASATAMQRIR